MLTQIQPSIASNTPETVNDAIGLIKQYHAYLDLLPVDMNCIETHYKSADLNNPADEQLLLEQLMLEFTDDHMHLNTNNNNSYRLNGDVVVKKTKDGFIISDFWKNQLIAGHGIQVGARLVSVNGVKPQNIIDEFPTHCLDKTNQRTQQWIINKVLAGVYSNPRIIQIETASSTVNVDLDAVKYHQQQKTLSHYIKNKVGIISIHNSLGQTELIAAFDAAIDALHHTEALVLDLRNTIGGGDSYLARAIIGRLINKPQAYQKHRFLEQQNGATKIPRNWVEYVEPRLPTYQQPVVVLVNHWTGSMGEGLAIGLQGMQRATIIGTEMAGLLGAVNNFPLKHLKYGFQMPVEQLYNIEGIPRELAKPNITVSPDSSPDDNILITAINHLIAQ